VEGEMAPGNKQQKHRFVVSTDVFCRRLQCIYRAATRMMCSCVHVSSAITITIALPAAAHPYTVRPVVEVGVDDARSDM
jgi:hypothetical protein